MSWHLLSPDGGASVMGVEEIQGLYGSYSFPEKLLQKIWLRGDFDREGMRTADGQRVRLGHPGKWNLLGGPDFKGARISFDDGPELIGDVELHLHAGGWAAHGHSADRAYDSVVLHVVLFPPAAGHTTRGSRDRPIPVLALLPLLHHDIEQFAAEEALESLANRPASRIQEELGRMPAAELQAFLRRHAEKRWAEKVHFARVRLQRLGWTAACHHAALEVLGYRFNRAPMLRIAGTFPFERWARGAIDAEAVLNGEGGGWSLQGIRPANHPRIRLRQYAAWTQANGAWPAKLAVLGKDLPTIPLEVPTGPVRRKHRLADWRERFSVEMCGGAVGGTRLDNLICDAFLPLLAAESGRELQALWFHWYAGDLPPRLSRALRMLGATDARAQPFSHGLAQGLLGWLLEQE